MLLIGVFCKVLKLMLDFNGEDELGQKRKKIINSDRPTNQPSLTVNWASVEKAEYLFNVTFNKKKRKVKKKQHFFTFEFLVLFIGDERERFGDNEEEEKNLMKLTSHAICCRPFHGNLNQVCGVFLSNYWSNLPVIFLV